MRDPLIVLEFGENDIRFFDSLPAHIRRDLCVDMAFKVPGKQNLVDVVLGEDTKSPLRNELSLLLFSIKFLDKIPDLEIAESECISPGQIQLHIKCESDVGEVCDLDISLVREFATDSLYTIPRWCKPGDRWRFQLGFLLRFILSRQSDFTANVLPENIKKRPKAYQPVKSHWYQRRYGLFNAQQSFGDDWVPITDWMEQFLLALLCWPGCRMPGEFGWVEGGIAKTQSKIQARIEYLKSKRGIATGLLMLPMEIGRPTPDSISRPLRACVVQTVVPDTDTFGDTDLTLSEQHNRRLHRSHISSALEAVRRMLHLRDTHEERDGRLARISHQ